MLIQLTLAANNEPIYVNPLHVVVMETFEDAGVGSITRLVMSIPMHASNGDNRDVHVTNPPEEIAKMIQEVL